MTRKHLIYGINIVICCLLIYIAFSYQQYFVPNRHDYFLPFSSILRLLRVPGSILFHLLGNYLPNLLNIPIKDFYSGIGAFIKAIIIFSVCFMFSTGFFLFFKKRFPLANIECFWVLPVSFFLFAIPILNIDDSYRWYGKVIEQAVFCEYFAAFFFYFLFWILIYLFVFEYNSQVIKKKWKILIVLCSFLVGFWQELFNVSTFFSLIAFGILYYLYTKKNFLCIKNLLFIIPFAIGTLCFYFICDNVTIHSVSGLPYDASEIVYNLSHYLDDFTIQYVKYLFIKNIYLWITIIFLIVCLYKTKEKNSRPVIILSVSLLLGWLAMNCVFIMFKNYTGSYWCDYLFQRPEYISISCNVLLFVILILIGALYKNVLRSRKYINIVFLLVFIILAHLYISKNSEIQKVYFENKLVDYEIEQKILYYNLLGESAILPAKYLQNDFVKCSRLFTLQDNFHYEQKEDYIAFMQNKYFDSLYSLYAVYYTNVYNRQFIGFQYKNDKYAESEFEKRLSILKALNIDVEETQNEIIKNKMSFKKLKKFNDIRLTLDNINKIKVTDENKELLLKIKAYINYQDNNIETALAQYNEYLTKNKDDIDALINVADIYMNLKKYDMAEKIYDRLILLDDNNQNFLYKLLYINFYEKKDYEKALKICDLMIAVQNNIYSNYINKYYILLCLGRIDEANNILSYIEKNRTEILTNFNVIENGKMLAKTKNASKVELMNPNFI